VLHPGDSVDHVIASLSYDGIRAVDNGPAQWNGPVGTAPFFPRLYLPSPRRSHPHNDRKAVELMDIATDTMTNSISMDRSIRTPPAPIGGRIRRNGFSSGSVIE
jgi:hypothetical protein